NSTTVIDPNLMRIVIFEKVKQYGLKPMLHCEIIDTNVENGELKSVIVKGKGEEIEIFADVFIDSTGDGDVSYLSGAEYEKGQYSKGEVKKEIQPGTLMFTVGGFKLEKFIDYLKDHPEELTHSESMKIRPGYTAEFLGDSKNHVHVGLRNTVSRLRKEGKCPIERDTIIYINLHKNRYIAINSIRIKNFDGSSVDDLSKGEIDGHLQILPLIEMLKENVPGFENIYLSSIA